MNYENEKHKIIKMWMNHSILSSFPLCNLHIVNCKHTIFPIYLFKVSKGKIEEKKEAKLTIIYLVEQTTTKKNNCVDMFIFFLVTYN